MALPDTLLEEHESLREKTVKLGSLARACSIYGVDFILVFRDEKGKGEARLIKKVLEYLETPQYLRKRMYPVDGSLRFAGLLPPLRIPSHRLKVPLEKVQVGEVREGLTNADGTVDIGLEENPKIRNPTGPNRRVTIRVTSKNPLTAEIIDRKEVNEYWGYVVETGTLDEILGGSRFGLKIATSKYGNTLPSQIFQLREAVRKAGSVLVAFGSPARGLFDMVGPKLSQEVQFTVNLFAEQHVQTVRTEEAVFAALNLLNNLAL